MLHGTLKDLVDVFTCCIFSWKALTTMLPAFLLAGAVGAFVPSQMILRYLGANARKSSAYAAASISGAILSLCSCNVVPLFLSIYKRGAGIGPAFAFLFSGPAISLVTAIFTFQVIGAGAGMWRIGSVLVISVITGILMAFIYRREEAVRQEEIANSTMLHSGLISRKIWPLFALLLCSVLYGGWEMPGIAKAIGMASIAILIATYFCIFFNLDEFKQWMWEFWGLVKLVIPILLVALLIIAFISSRVDIKWINHWLNFQPGDTAGLVRSTFFGDVFGALMYFPIMTEIALVKAFLKAGMSIGPGMAILLAGPGLSLPGAIIVSRAIGWKKVAVYQVIVIVLVLISALLFVSEIGQYICSCMMTGG